MARTPDEMTPETAASVGQELATRHRQGLDVFLVPSEEDRHVAVENIARHIIDGLKTPAGYFMQERVPVDHQALSVFERYWQELEGHWRMPEKNT